MRGTALLGTVLIFGLITADSQLKVSWSFTIFHLFLLHKRTVAMTF